MRIVSVTEPPVSAHLNAKHAVAIASRFLDTIGQPSLNPARATYVGHSKRSDEAYYQPLWRVQFGNGPGILVSDTGEHVVSYSYGPVQNNINRFPDVPSGVNLSREEAIERAIQVLAASGVNRNELSTPDAQIMNTTDGKSFGDRLWIVCWDRVKSGIPYDDQRIAVGLQSETGQLLSLMVRFTTVDAVSTEVIVNEKQAISLAKTHLKLTNTVDAHISQAVLVLAPKLTQSGIVDPNSPPVPCWQVGFTRKSGQSEEIFDVNVDALSAAAYTGKSSIPIGR